MNLCLLWIPEQGAGISQYGINWMVFECEVCCEPGGTGTGFSPCTSLLYNSINVDWSSSPTCFQKDKRAKPGTLPKSIAIGEHWTQKCIHISFFLHPWSVDRSSASVRSCFVLCNSYVFDEYERALLRSAVVYLNRISFCCHAVRFVLAVRVPFIELLKPFCKASFYLHLYTSPSVSNGE